MTAWTGIQSQKLLITPDIKNQTVLRKLTCKLEMFSRLTSNLSSTLIKIWTGSKLMRVDESWNVSESGNSHQMSSFPDLSLRKKHKGVKSRIGLKNLPRRGKHHREALRNQRQRKKNWSNKIGGIFFKLSRSVYWLNI